jgi:hypothetical protein
LESRFAVVPVELDKTRHIHYGLRAVRDLEAALGGKPLASILQDLSLIGINALIIALYHGLKKEDPSLNANLVERMLEAHLDAGNSLQPVYMAVSKAIEETNVFRTSEDAASGKAQTPTPA